MTGIHVKRENYFWSSIDGFSRRNIKITLSSGAQPFKTTKEKLKRYLAGNVSKKGIVYSSTDSGAAKAKKELDTWLDMDRVFDGDVILIVGKQHFKLKVEKVTSFTKSVNADELIKQDKLYPRVIAATSNFIGAGVDSNDVCIVKKLGMPSSKIEWMQEMGRCGRVDGEDITRHDEYMLMLQLENYVYLNERLFIEKEKGEVKDDLTSEERELKKMQSANGGSKIKRL